MKKLKASLIKTYFQRKELWDNLTNYMQSNCFISHEKGILIIFTPKADVEKNIREQICDKELDKILGTAMLLNVEEIDAEVAVKYTISQDFFPTNTPKIQYEDEEIYTFGY